ncbi:hypothetical protein [Mongoliitalea daihaiensis]|uniref:hypothetical protein n=1 Tax=Mongoliitalea daihaiensis TaxID=2782006 RepID=UPI001F3E00E0|nr:hypothetical protein [Mongoliitalea daihaiensis]UJP64258.1 hypothetical protein IPZ59_15805 [Mongoliitalea daihaiensis]
METAFTLIFLTVIYAAVILSFFPERYSKKLSHYYSHHKSPGYQKVSLSGPIFFSLLIGYTIASTMMYFIIQ